MISLITPPKDQVSRISKMLADEYGTASNIKSRVNRYGDKCILLIFFADFYIYSMIQIISAWCDYFNTAEIKAIHQNSR